MSQVRVGAHPLGPRPGHRVEVAGPGQPGEPAGAAQGVDLRVELGLVARVVAPGWSRSLGRRGRRSRRSGRRWLGGCYGGGRCGKRGRRRGRLHRPDGGRKLLHLVVIDAHPAVEHVGEGRGRGRFDGVNHGETRGSVADVLWVLFSGRADEGRRDGNGQGQSQEAQITHLLGADSASRGTLVGSSVLLYPTRGCSMQTQDPSTETISVTGYPTVVMVSGTSRTSQEPPTRRQRAFQP